MQLCQTVSEYTPDAANMQYAAPNFIHRWIARSDLWILSVGCTNRIAAATLNPPLELRILLKHS